jgi:hypothetical protein
VRGAVLALEVARDGGGGAHPVASGGERYVAGLIAPDQGARAQRGFGPSRGGAGPSRGAADGSSEGPAGTADVTGSAALAPASATTGIAVAAGSIGRPVGSAVAAGAALASARGLAVCGTDGPDSPGGRWRTTDGAGAGASATLTTGSGAGALSADRSAVRATRAAVATTRSAPTMTWPFRRSGRG